MPTAATSRCSTRRAECARPRAHRRAGHARDAARAGRARPPLHRRRPGSRAGDDRAGSRRTRGCDPRRPSRRGAALLAVCGGYQLLGRGYRGRDGSWLEGVGLFPHETVAGDTRMIGDVLLESTLPEARGRRSPASRTTQAGRSSTTAPRRSGASWPATATTARRGSRDAGSVGRSGRTSTARCSHAIRGSPTSCCHGPSRTRTGDEPEPLAALGDELETQAHAVAAERARRRGGRPA